MQLKYDSDGGVFTGFWLNFLTNFLEKVKRSDDRWEQKDVIIFFKLKNFKKKINLSQQKAFVFQNAFVFQSINLHIKIILNLLMVLEEEEQLWLKPDLKHFSKRWALILDISMAKCSCLDHTKKREMSLTV